MRAPPDLKMERAAPGTEAAQQNVEGLVNAFEQFQYKPSSNRNTSPARATEGYPVAVAEPLGSICHVLSVHHVGGALENKGFFSCPAEAAITAHELNTLFQQERGSS